MRRLACFGLAVVGLAAGALPTASQTAAPVGMVAITAFTQGKLTDASGVVTFRVGGTFAPTPADPLHFTVTVICTGAATPGPVALLIGRSGAPASLAGGAATITARVDDKAAVTIAADRAAGGGVAAYTVKAGPDAEALSVAMAAGQHLRLDLDGFAADVPLAGFGTEMAALAKVCPHR